MQNEYTKGLLDKVVRIKKEVRKLHGCLRDRDKKIVELQNELSKRNAQFALIHGIKSLEKQAWGF